MGAPLYIQTGQSDGVLFSTANTNLNGTGSVVMFTATTTAGARIEQIHLQALGTTTLGMIRLFIKIGSTYYPLKEVPVTAVTPDGANGVPAWSADLNFNPPLLLEKDASITIATQKAESFSSNITLGGDL